MEKMSKVFLPRGRKNEENFVIVSVNGRNYKIRSTLSPPARWR